MHATWNFHIYIDRNKEEGTFLVRRKDARTLVLSYKGNDDANVHHVLIEFQDQKFYIGSAKVSMLFRYIYIYIYALKSVSIVFRYHGNTHTSMHLTVGYHKSL
jgi:hypothetical protein